MSSRNRQRQSNTYTYYSEDQVKLVLIASGIEIVYEMENDIMLFCPFHNNYRSPAGEVSKETGIFWCFSCQESKSLEELIMHVTQKSYFEVIRIIDSKKDNKDLLEQISDKLNKSLEFKEYDKDTIDRLHTMLFNSPKAQEYLLGRGITKESMSKYKLGYSSIQGMITVPVYSPDGLCLGMVGRSIEGKVFRNSPDLPKSKTLFNLSRNKRVDRVFVVESSFDAIKIEQAGGYAVATLGATVSKEQRKLLKQYFNQVIALGDMDMAGQNMSNKLLTDLGPEKCIIAKLPEGIKDVSELDEESLKRFVSSFDNIVHSMLQ